MAFHINDKGEAGKCSATQGNCPYGSEDEHYLSKQDAQRAYELEQEKATIPTVRSRAVEVNRAAVAEATALREEFATLATPVKVKHLTSTAKANIIEAVEEAENPQAVVQKYFNTFFTVEERYRGPKTSSAQRLAEAWEKYAYADYVHNGRSEEAQGRLAANLKLSDDMLAISAAQDSPRLAVVAKANNLAPEQARSMLNYASGDTLRPHHTRRSIDEQMEQEAPFMGAFKKYHRTHGVEGTAEAFRNLLAFAKAHRPA